MPDVSVGDPSEQFIIDEKWAIAEVRQRFVVTEPFASAKALESFASSGRAETRVLV